MGKIEKWSTLALLRFILASIVACGHLSEYTNPGALTLVAMLGSFEAILGFLLISGYSIGESYAKNPEGFYLRRAKRIYPVYLASLALALFAQPQPFTVPFVLYLLANLFFLNQLVTTSSFVGPAWSLSLEVWLYASAPLFKRLAPKTLWFLVAGSLLFYIVQTCGRALLHWRYGAELGYGLNYPALAFIWILGCILAWHADKPRTLRIIGLVFAGHLLLGLAIQFVFRLKNHFLSAFPHDLLGFAFQAITLAVIWLLFRSILCRNQPATRKSSWMSFLGDISYPLYLVHKPLYTLLQRWHLTTNPYLMFASAFALAAVAYLALDFYTQKRERKS